jgi:translation initiation factor 2 beta subunit (eIF-2beta)/eIF-5
MKSKNDSYIKEQKELRKKLMNLIAELDKKEQLTLQKSFKQETLEEAAEKYENSFKESDGTESVDFIEGAKWQAERMYSEEDLEKAFKHGILFKEESVSTCEEAIETEFSMLVEQLKKKS